MNTSGAVLVSGTSLTSEIIKSVMACLLKYSQHVFIIITILII